MAADLGIFNAKIRTMDPSQPFASALAVKDGTIIAIGTDAEVRDYCDGTTEQVDAGGHPMSPGLTDGHQHLFEGAVVGRGLDFDRVADLDTVREILHRERLRVGPDAWITGHGLEYAALGGHAYHHELIDAASGPGPVLIYSLDLHTGFANGEALRRSGVTGSRSFPDGARIVCDEDGRPTGELRERSAFGLVLAHVDGASHEQRLGWYADAIRRQLAVGITSIHQMDGDAQTVEVLGELEAAGLLDMRVALHYFIVPGTEPDFIESLIRERHRGGRRWRADGVKFMLDGVIETGTSWLEDPDSAGGGTESMWPVLADYRSRVTDFDRAGYRIATHAIGDRAVREVLDTYTTLPSGVSRHRVEHIETAPPGTLARFRPEQVTASMQPIHLRWLKPDLSDPWSQRLGHQRCAHAMPSGDLSAAGGLVVLGSDWPVAPFDPRLGMFAARLRRAPDEEDPRAIGASRPLSAEETLAGYTVNSARAVGEEAVGGMLRQGFRADLVIWGEDLVDCAPADVVDVPVLLTVVDGQVVHRAEE